MALNTATGRISEEPWDFSLAREWFRKSLEIAERLGNEHGAVKTCLQLGNLAGAQEDYPVSGQWLLKAVLSFLKANDSDSAYKSINNYRIFYNRSSPADKAKLRKLWEAAGLGEFPVKE